jgi:hypothetical protein
LENLLRDVYPGLRSSDSLQPRLSYRGPLALNEQGSPSRLIHLE